MKGFGEHQKHSRKKKKVGLANNASINQLIKKALDYHSQGLTSKAAKYYQLLLDNGFTNPTVLSNFGLIYIETGYPEKAIKLFKKSISLFPESCDAYNNLGSLLRELGNPKEAEKYLQKVTEIDPKSIDYLSNLVRVLVDLGELREADYYISKVIDLDPSNASNHNKRGLILNDLGMLQEAKISFIKAIELNPNYAAAYFHLSRLNPSKNQAISHWENNLFSESLLSNSTQQEKVSIYFARANILHKSRDYDNSKKYLELANNTKLSLFPSRINHLLEKSKDLLSESNNMTNISGEFGGQDYIFIVGMPRSGSTLIESIISMNKDVKDLGERNILEESFLDWKSRKKGYKAYSLSELYQKRVQSLFNESKLTTNKCLHNYRYVGIISRQMPKAKIIHCYRNPLDNILSIYRANFAYGNRYSSSLTDCARIYLDQEEIMSTYKKKYTSNIYQLNYDLLVGNPDSQIRSLVSWLCWQWNDSYLTPHLNTRSVSTASSVQVRSPINNKSLGGWEKYKTMLEPAIKIITKAEKYQGLTT